MKHFSKQKETTCLPKAVVTLVVHRKEPAHLNCHFFYLCLCVYVWVRASATLLMNQEIIFKINNNT